MAVLPARMFKPRRYRPGNIGAWSGHLPFAADLIAASRPSILVELGTHYGEAYFGMCQAIDENGVSCQCYAVDTWKGDEHAAYYGESVFAEVSRYNEANYSSFSKLLRTTFDDARQSFGDGTIDLLHIDGLHTYDAVRHDFDSWIPKVRPGGIVLLHDTTARHLDFQVWRLWEELEREYPHFEFLHSWGLGVLRKPGGVAADTEFVQAVLSGSQPEQTFLRHYYSTQAEVLSRDPVLRNTAGSAPTYFQVFPHLANGYTEQSAVGTDLTSGEWQDIVLELPTGSAGGRIRLDPADRPCVVELASVLLKRAVDGSVLQHWTSTDIRTFSPLSSLVVVPNSETAAFLSTGVDPWLLLPNLDPSLLDEPLILEARVRIHHDLTQVGAVLQSADALLARTGDMAGAEQTRNQQLSAEIRNLQAERVAVVADYRRVHALNESLLNEAASLRNRLASHEERAQELATLKADLRMVYASRSWRLTAPLRAVFRAIR